MGSLACEHAQTTLRPTSPSSRPRVGYFELSFLLAAVCALHPARGKVTGPLNRCLPYTIRRILGESVPNLVQTHFLAARHRIQHEDIHSFNTGSGRSPPLICRCPVDCRWWAHCGLLETVFAVAEPVITLLPRGGAQSELTSTNQNPPFATPLRQPLRQVAR